MHGGTNMHNITVNQYGIADKKINPNGAKNRILSIKLAFAY